MTNRHVPHRLVAVVVTVAGVALTGWYASAVPTDGTAVWLLVLGATAWSTIAFALLASIPRRRTADGEKGGGGAGAVDPGAKVTVVVVASADDPVEIVRTSVALAADTGRVLLVEIGAAPRDEVAALARSLSLPLVADTSVQAALDRSLAQVTTTSMTVVRARACVVTDELRAAAARIRGDVAWVTGAVEAYNDDGFSPAQGRSVGEALRSDARGSGVALWCPDATVVRTDAVVAAGGFRSDRPWGSVLRAMAAQGLRGVAHPGVVAVVATPSEPEPFWRVRVAEARAQVAECTDALLRPGVHGRHGWGVRAAAAGLLLRDLRGWVLLAWMLAAAAVAVSGVAPSGRSPWLFTVAAAACAAARTCTLAARTRRVSSPVRDAIDAVLEFPVSLSASAGLARRAAPLRRPTQLSTLVPGRLLGWAAVLLTVTAAMGIAELAGAVTVESAGWQPWGVAGCVLGILALAMGIHRSATLRRSGRATFRFPVSMPARIGGIEVVTDDVSPGGMRLRGPLAGQVTVGAPLHVEVTTPAGTTSLHVEVRHTFKADGDTVIGVRLLGDDRELAAWTRTVFAAAGVLRPRDAVVAA